MPLFITQGRFTREYIRGGLAAGGPSRRHREALRAGGGKARLTSLHTRSIRFHRVLGNAGRQNRKRAGARRSGARWDRRIGDDPGFSRRPRRETCSKRRARSPAAISRWVHPKPPTLSSSGCQLTGTLPGWARRIGHAGWERTGRDRFWRSSSSWRSPGAPRRQASRGRSRMRPITKMILVTPAVCTDRSAELRAPRPGRPASRCGLMRVSALIWLGII